MKVLVIDDDLISRMALVDVLGDLPDIEICEAESGEQAWELLSQGLHPVLCCCDVRMPGMSGIGLFRRMRSVPRFSHIPVLMVTSASDRETVTEALKLGARGFIVKPFHAADVRAKIEATLGANLESMFEDAQATLKRLGIPMARYVTYLDALAGQIDGALEKAQAGTALDHRALDALHTGCLTLGANHCAQVIHTALKSLERAPLTPAHVQSIADLPPLLRRRAARFKQAAPAP